MESIARKSDERRIFTPEFKRQQIERVLRGEVTLAELSRELQIARPLLARWKHLIASGAETAVAANEDVVPASELKAAQQRIRELERIIGKQAVDLEILRAARDGADIRRLMRQAAFARFGNESAAEPVQWLSDNEAIYTALETVIAAERLNLVPITTPVASPESNGIAEAFVHTLRRDYVDAADRSSAERVLAQVPGWIADYNTFAPHSSLGMKSPAEHRSGVQTHDAETCLTK